MDQSAQIAPEITITLSIKEVKCESFSFTEYAIENKNPINANGYEFILTGGLQVIDNEKLIIVVVSTKIFEKRSESLKFELAELKSRCIFYIENFDSLIKRIDTNLFHIPEGLLALCQNISISSIRGMVSVKLDDTMYSNAILPIIDGRLLLPKKN